MSHWKDVFKDAVSAASGKLQPKGRETHSFLATATAAHKRSLESLFVAFTDGKIDEDTTRAELTEEKRALRAELLAAPAIKTKSAQSATNAFFAVIEKSFGGSR